MGDRTLEPAEEEAPGLQLVGDRTQEPAEEEAPDLQVEGDRTQEPAEEEAPGLQLVGDRTQEPAEEEAPRDRPVDNANEGVTTLSRGGAIPPRSCCDFDVYVSSNVSTSMKEPQYCIMYASGQQQRGPEVRVKAPDPPKAAPKVSAPLDGACLRGKNMRCVNK